MPITESASNQRTAILASLPKESSFRRPNCIRYGFEAWEL